MGGGKCGFLEVRTPEKAAEAKVRLRVRALTVMDLALISQLGFPRGEVTERSEDQGKGKGPRRYEPCSPSSVCASPWEKCGRGVSSFRPNFSINR